MSIRPLGPRVLVRPIAAPPPDPGRLVVELDAVPPAVADVIAVGALCCPSCGFRTEPAEIGTRVLLRPTAIYQDITIDGETYWMVLADDVIGTLTEAHD